jgi:hypothetical protein
MRLPPYRRGHSSFQRVIIDEAPMTLRNHDAFPNRPFYVSKGTYNRIDAQVDG